jgi:hypothetical protein
MGMIYKESQGQTERAVVLEEEEEKEEILGGHSPSPLTPPTPF